MAKKTILVVNPVTKEGKIKPLPKNLQRLKPDKDGKYTHRPVFKSSSRGHIGTRSEKKVLQNKQKPKTKRNGVSSMAVANKRGKKKTSPKKNPATVNPVANKKRKKSYRNPSFTNSFSGSGIMDTALDGVMVAGSGILVKKVPDWLAGILPMDNKLWRYVAMLALTVGGGFALNAFGQKRVAKNLVMGGIGAITVEALIQFFPQFFGEGGTFRPVKNTMSRIVVNPAGQMLLKGSDGNYTELSAYLTPEELARQQMALIDNNAVVNNPAGRSGAADSNSTSHMAGSVEFEGDDYETVEGDYNDDLDGLNDFSYRNRINQFSYR